MMDDEELENMQEHPLEDAEIAEAEGILRDVQEGLSHKIPVANHLEKDEVDQCGYCGQHFGPEDVVIVKTIYGRTWHFCSEECYRDFVDASNFKDEDLDGDKTEPVANVEEESTEEDEF